MIRSLVSFVFSEYYCDLENLYFIGNNILIWKLNNNFYNFKIVYIYKNKINVFYDCLKNYVFYYFRGEKKLRKFLLVL